MKNQFTTTQVILFNVLREWKRLKELEHDRIEIVLDKDVLTMTVFGIYDTRNN